MPRTKHGGLYKRCGHSARAWTTCADPWWMRFHHAGHEYRFNLHREAQKPAGAVMDKDEARQLQNTYKAAIQAGTFRQAPAVAAPDVRLTVGDVLDTYLKTHVEAPGRSHASQVVMTSLLNRLRTMDLPAANGTTVRLEQKPVDSVTTADVDVLRRDWTLNVKGARGGVTGPTRALKRLRHFFNWAVQRGYLDRTPFTRGGVATVHFAKEPGRTRRLEGDEEARLLKHAVSPWIKALITAALETGCRVGELLALRWRDVQWEANVLLIPAAITKTNEARDVPISRNLKAILELQQHAPDGSTHGDDAFVFGNAFGERVSYWRVREDWKATCEAAQVAGVNFHDLRRTAASALRMSGAPDHLVAAWLGHSNITTTSRYLRASSAEKQKHLAAFEAHRAQAPTTGTRAKKKTAKIRTRFAHGASRTARKPTRDTASKLLN